MADLIRDAPLGQLIRWVTRNKVLQYPEEQPDFKCPKSYSSPAEASLPEPSTDDAPRGEEAVDDALSAVESEDPDLGLDLEKTHTLSRALTGVSRLSQVGTQGEGLQHTITQQDIERAYTNAASVRREPSRPIAPKRTEDGTILVDWYTTDDPANPQNWSFGKKSLVALQIYLYTFGVYMGSAIYTPSQPGVMARFGVSQQVGALGLSMYVLAYGIGPLLWSPLSEIPVVGRNLPYMTTFAIFVILCVPTALADSMAGLVVLRFLQGFFGSPALATGGASLGDLFSLIKLPYALSLWAVAATCGPSFGPVIAGFSVAAEDWRWSLWEILWLAGPVWISMFVLLPETSASNILLRRAQRLRKLTGNRNLKAQSEIDQANFSVRGIAVEALWRPIQLMLLDPAIAFTAIYTALVYGIYYSFFESFPLVYIGMYGFNIGEMGLTFLCITVAVVISIAMYWSYLYWSVEPSIKAKGLGPQERRLIPALIASFLCPIGLFIFAWTSDPEIHWIVSVIGIGIFTIGIFIVLQCIFVYLPMTYPMYAASLFAGNDVARSTLATGAIHFSQPLFHNLGVGSGVSMLAAFTAVCVGGVFVLYFYGAKLRARSRFAVH